MWPVWQPVSHSRRQNISAGFSVHHSLLQDMAATVSSERIAVVRLYLGGVVPWKLISSRSDSTPSSHDEAWRGISEIAPQALADDGCTAPGWLLICQRDVSPVQSRAHQRIIRIRLGFRTKEEALPFSVVLQTSLPSGWREKLSFSKTRRE